MMMKSSCGNWKNGNSSNAALRKKPNGKKRNGFGVLKPAIIAPPPPTRPLLRIIIRMTQNRQQVTRIRPGLTPPTRRKTPAGVGKIA